VSFYTTAGGRGWVERSSSNGTIENKGTKSAFVQFGAFTV